MLHSGTSKRMLQQRASIIPVTKNTQNLLLIQFIMFPWELKNLNLHFEQFFFVVIEIDEYCGTWIQKK